MSMYLVINKCMSSVIRGGNIYMPPKKNDKKKPTRGGLLPSREYDDNYCTNPNFKNVLSKINLNDIDAYCNLVKTFAQGFMISKDVPNTGLYLPQFVKDVSVPIIYFKGWGGDISSVNIYDFEKKFEEAYKVAFMENALRKPNTRHILPKDGVKPHIRAIISSMKLKPHTDIYLAFDGDTITKSEDLNKNFTYFFKDFIDGYGKINKGAVRAIVSLKLTTCENFKNDTSEYIESHNWDTYYKIPLYVFQIPFKDEIKAYNAFSLFLAGNTLIINPPIVVCFGGGKALMEELSLIQKYYSSHQNIEHTLKWIILNVPRGIEMMEIFKEHPERLMEFLTFQQDRDMV